MSNKSETINPEDQIITDNGTFDVSEKIYLEDVTPRHILSFAKSILVGLAILFLIGMGIECYRPGGEVFAACKLTLPSLATLVIGYYFGTTQS